MLRVVFTSRPNALVSPGGDTIQLLQTKQELERLFDMDIRIALTIDELEDGFKPDFVHAFNLQCAANMLPVLTYAKSRWQIPIVLSTIYWDLSPAIFVSQFFKRFKRMPTHPQLAKLKWTLMRYKRWESNLGRGSFWGGRKYVRDRLSLLTMANLLLPNSTEELDILIQEFGLPERQIREFRSAIVPNAITYPEEANDNLSPELLAAIPENAVLCVGRVESVKNQLAIIEALFHQPDIPIVLVGRAEDAAYGRQVRALGDRRGNVHWIDELPHAGVLQLYKRAAVHVQPSFRESCGLSTMEAIGAGCRIVYSAPPYAPEATYQFQRFGAACNPFDIASIRSAIHQALAMPAIEPEDIRVYQQQFSWENVAMRTYEAYQQVLPASVTAPSPSAATRDKVCIS